MVDNYTGNYTFGENGVIIPDTSDILETVQQEYTIAFADYGEISLEEATPQGRLIDTEVNSRIATITFNAQIANVLINIFMSSGSALDAWGANFDIPRIGETPSTVVATLTGVPNTVIPANSEAQDDNNIIWRSESEIILNAQGTGTGIFACTKDGAVELGVNQLKTIVASSSLGVDGWETITNTVSAALGNEKEPDIVYKQRILDAIFNASALFGNYASAIYREVDGVKDVFTYDNPRGQSILLDNITIPAHSVYVCVDGGNSQDIAQALYAIKSAGAGWTGNTSVVVIDPVYNTSNPIKYQNPVIQNIIIEVELVALTATTSDLENDVKDTITNYFNNDYLAEGYSKIGIRSVLKPFTIATLLTSKISGVSINSVKVGLETPAPHALVNIIKASVTQGIEYASCNSTTFATQVSDNDVYEFIYDGSNWKLDGVTKTLSNYGISIIGTPIQNDKILITYATGDLDISALPLFATEKPLITSSNIQVTING